MLERLPAPVAAIAVVVAPATAYVVFLGYRRDYAGHYLSGLGATLLLVCASWAFRPGRGTWTPLLVALTAIVLGATTEATIFREAIFDPVDFANQSLGALAAGGAILDRRLEARDVALLPLVGIVIVGAGFFFAFV